MVLLPSATVLGKGSKVLRGAVSRTQLPPPPCSEHRLPEALLLLLDHGPASWQVSLPPAPPSMLSDSLSHLHPQVQATCSGLPGKSQLQTQPGCCLLPSPPPAALTGPCSPSISGMEPTPFSACRAQHAHLLCVAAFHLSLLCCPPALSICTMPLAFRFCSTLSDK